MPKTQETETKGSDAWLISFVWFQQKSFRPSNKKITANLLLLVSDVITSLWARKSELQRT